jgi:hypothetical protein
VHGHFVDLHFEVVDLASHVGDVLLVYVNFDFVLVLGSLFLVQKHGVLRFDVGDLVIKSQKVVLEILEFEELLFERGNHGVLVRRLDLVEMEIATKISLHVLPFFYFEMIIFLKNINPYKYLI